MATDIMQPLRYVIDLQSGLVQTPMRSQLMKGDKKANRVIVELTDGGKVADLTGIAASGSFIRPPDAAEIPLNGSTDGNKAIVILDDACYAQDGYCEINVALTVGETKRTILSLTGYVLTKGSGAYVDVSGVIPNLDDIIAQYAQMKEVTESAQEAADKANDAASRAPYVGYNGNWFVWNAETGKYVDSGSKAQGPVGPQGPAGANGTGSGTVTGVKVDGQTYQPDRTGMVTLPKMGGGVPDGGTTGQMLFKTSDDNGAAEWQTPTAQKVGALGSDPQEDESTEAPEMGSVPIYADDSGKLGGKTYQQVLDAAENQVKQKADTMVIEGSSALVTSGAVYSALHPKSDFVSLTMANGASVGEPGNSYYVVRNGMCFVNLAGLRVPQEAAGKEIVVNMPKAAMRANTQFTLGGSTPTYPIIYIDGLATSLKCTAATTDVYINLQYPVANE